MRPPVPPPLPPELAAVLARLRLPYIRRAAPEVLATARAQRWEPDLRLLRPVLTDRQELGGEVAEVTILFADLGG